jgi:hypothetical protein
MQPLSNYSLLKYENQGWKKDLGSVISDFLLARKLNLKTFKNWKFPFFDFQLGLYAHDATGWNRELFARTAMLNVLSKAAIVKLCVKSVLLPFVTTATCKIFHGRNGFAVRRLLIAQGRIVLYTTQQEAQDLWMIFQSAVSNVVRDAILLE